MDNKSEKSTQKQKYLQPKFHFGSEMIKIGDDYTSDKISVSELVRAGQLLADFPNFQRFADKGYLKAPLLPGENTKFSEDEESIIATVAGYPKVRKENRSNSPEPTTILSLEPLFIVSPDQMKLSLSIHPPLQGKNSLKMDDLESLLEEDGIKFGIVNEVFEDIKEFLAEGEQEFRKFIIAHGQPVGISKDAYLRYELEIGPIAGTLLENGSIDYRDRRIMVGIKNGQCIATKIPAVQGAPGIDIYGEETPAPEGKDLKVTVQNDARFNPETLEVTATKDGVLSLVNDNVIKVLSHKTISGDVDFATGNVESMNAVSILGSVQPGFKVNVVGDLKIAGSVMSASIFSEGNLVVSGGITGKNSSLETSGDADINFIEQGVLKCGGMAVIRKQSYYSDILAASHIRCQPSSIIMGGKIIAGGSISLGEVGSDNSIPSIIAAGTVADRVEHFEELKKSVSEQQDEIIQWLQRYRGSSRSKKVKQMEQKLADTKLLLLRFNLIPGTGKYSRAAGPDDELPENDEDYNSAGAIAINEISINVAGTIHAGTEIRIGNRTMKLEKTVSNRKFILTPNGKRIISKPLKM